MRKEKLPLTFLTIAVMTFIAPAKIYRLEERVIWSPSTGSFWAYERDNATWGDSIIDITGHLGDSSYTPSLADINGDGLDDRVVVRWETNQFVGYCRYTDTDGSLPDVGVSSQESMGADISLGDKIMFGNFNSDGINDTVMCRTSNMLWFVKETDGSAGFATSAWSQKGAFGQAGDIPLYADINGDGFDDRIVVRVNGSSWTTYVDYSTDSAVGDGVQDINVTRGINATDRVAFSDINGDGLDDYILVCTNGTTYDLYGYYTYFDGVQGNYVLGGIDPNVQYSGADATAGHYWLFGQIDGLSRDVDNLPSIPQLPDPFLMNNGLRTSTLAEWDSRREEIKEILQFYEYGFMAPEPSSWSVRVLSSGSWPGGSYESRRMTVYRLNGDSTSFDFNVFIPDSNEPFPVVVVPGNDSANATECLDRDYMMIGVVKETLDPDIEETDVVGPVQQLYPEYDWGSLAVWAWGCSRVMDYAETRNDVQLNHVIVKGHSRTGKAALIAGAFDERFAITSSNGGGMGGPAVHRITNPNSDQLSSATFYHWFQESLEDFIDKEDKLPFDQHWLAGLVAPRYLLITNGIDDNWANVLGQQACCEAAQHIFDALGADQIGIHFRDGGHDTNEDYTETLDYADWKFFGIPTARNFNNYLFVYTPGYTWTTPTLY